MEDERHHPCSHPRQRDRRSVGPKLTTAGRIDAEVDGQPVTIRLQPDQVTIEPQSLRTVWAMRNVVPRHQIAPLLDQATGLLGATGSRGRIVVRMYGRELELAPNPGPVARRILGLRT